MSEIRFTLLTAVAACLCFLGGIGLAQLAGGKDGAAAAGGPRSGPSAAKLTALTKRPNSAVRHFSAISRSGELGMFAKFSGYFRLISKAEAHEMAGLLETIRRDVPKEMGGDPLVKVLAIRWAELDPASAFDALLSGRPPGIEEAARLEGGPPGPPHRESRSIFNLWEVVPSPTVRGRIQSYAALNADRPAGLVVPPPRIGFRPMLDR